MSKAMMRMCKGDASLMPEDSSTFIDKTSGHKCDLLHLHNPISFDIGRQFGTFVLHVEGTKMPKSTHANVERHLLSSAYGTSRSIGYAFVLSCSKGRGVRFRALNHPQYPPWNARPLWWRPYWREWLEHPKAHVIPAQIGNFAQSTSSSPVNYN